MTVLASSFGPWLSLLLFRRLGNKWVAADCRAVLLCGVALMAVPLALMLCFDDDRALKHHGQPLEQQQQQQPHGADGLERQRQQQREQQALMNGGSWGSATATSSGYEPLPAEPATDVEAGTDGAAATAAAPMLTPPAQASLAAAPSAASLVSLPDEGSCSVASAAEQEPSCCCFGCAGSCCGLPAGVAVTLLITGSDLIGALASGERLAMLAV